MMNGYAKFSPSDLPLEEEDKEVYGIMRDEKDRQRSELNLIASENYPSRSVLQALACCLQNRYSEGYPGARYYAGQSHIDRMELLCQKRALELFNLDPEKWGVNVQAYSGSPANFAVYTALVGPHGRIMGLDLPDGGHLTHGFQTPSKKVSATSIYFESMPYRLNPATGLIDYDALLASAKLFRPKLIVAGVSCHSRLLDYERFRKICDEVNALLFADMAHIAGLVAGRAIPGPFEYADVVTTTVHKSLRGPRSALIFFRRGPMEKAINEAVFPGLQGGPHNHTVASLAVALRQAAQPSFSIYASRVVENAKALCKGLGDDIVICKGTDNHLMLVDVRSYGIDGGRAEFCLELAGITCNKNACPGDKSVLRPGGVRFGTPALTSRGLGPEDMEIVADFAKKVFEIAARANKSLGTAKLAAFKEYVSTNNEFRSELEAIRKEVASFALRFHLPGLDQI